MRLLTTNSITVECAQDCPVVAMLRPRSGHAQWVVAERYELKPWVSATEYVDGYGNLCQRFVIPQGRMVMKVSSEVEVADQLAVDVHAQFTQVASLPDSALVYLLQSRYCPSDKMEDRAHKITKGCSPGYAQAERIRAWIQEKLRYEYGVSDQTTDALDTLRHGAGVCRDFAHVGVSLCRSLQIPARFVVGYLHKLDPMDMHAWYEAYVGGQWYTFDPTQDKPLGGRVVVAYGRDAADVAFLSNYGEMELTKMEVGVHELKTL